MDNITPIEDFDNPDYNPFLEDDVVFGDSPNPYPLLARLREQGQVVEGDYRIACGISSDVTMSGKNHFMVLGYEAAAEVFARPDDFSNHVYSFSLGLSFGKSISTMDAPDHTRFRRIFQKAFLPGKVAKWSEKIVDPVVKGLMDKFVKSGKADLIQDFTIHFPFQIIYRQLALPERDIATFQKLAIAQTAIAMDPTYGIEAGRKLGTYFTAMVAARRENPGDDLVSELVQVEVDGVHLPEDVLISFFRQLVNAAGDTTYRATSVLLYALLHNPDQLQAIRDDRGLIGPAIEEALRWDGPVLKASRYAARDVELCGVKIPAGSILDVLSGSANHDQERYHDADRFNIYRDNSKLRNLAFAAGPHVCLGQHLARVEMTRAMHAVLDHLPGLRLDTDVPGSLIRGTMMRVPKHLHVRFDTPA